MSMKVRLHLDVCSSTCPSMECSYGLASRRRLVCVPIYTVVAAKLSSGILSFDSLDPLLASVVSLGVSFGTAGFISIVLHSVRGCISTSFVTSCDPTLRSLLTLR